MPSKPEFIRKTDIKKNIDDIREQLKKMGCMYDWDAELMTCALEYYKWNQWIFLQMYKRGLHTEKLHTLIGCPRIKPFCK